MDDIHVTAQRLFIDSEASRLKRAETAFLSWLTKYCRTKGSRASYLSDLDLFGTYLKSMGMTVFTVHWKAVEEYMEALIQQNLSASTRAKKLTVIKGLIRTLAMADLFPTIEAEKILSIELPKVPSDRRTPGLNRQEARLLLDAPSPDSLIGIRDRALLAVMLYTGAKRSAICSIRVGHLFCESGKNYIALQEKGDRMFTVPLHDEAFDRVQAWINGADIDRRQQEAYLFRPFDKRGVSLSDKPLDGFMVWYTVKKYARKVGLTVDRLNERGICAHSTRVTAITASFKGGASLEEIQELVGHKDARNTLRYYHPSVHDAQNAVQSIKYDDHLETDQQSGE
ncbi:MAG: tyrosine-type recombinase/integrase [Chitinivibrionales bacterium]|nr:tyrosine-type recombinase/integrase [Chitinivibrionales bacterium]